MSTCAGGESAKALTLRRKQHQTTILPEGAAGRAGSDDEVEGLAGTVVCSGSALALVAGVKVAEVGAACSVDGVAGGVMKGWEGMPGPGTRTVGRLQNEQKKRQRSG